MLLSSQSSIFSYALIQKFLLKQKLFCYHEFSYAEFHNYIQINFCMHFEKCNNLCSNIFKTEVAVVNIFQVIIGIRQEISKLKKLNMNLKIGVK